MDNYEKNQPQYENPEELTETKIIENWDDLDIKVNLLRGIYCMGFEKPSPIQQKAILPILQKRDCIAQAQSGTGKTATFSIGTLQTIDESKKEIQAIILEPTHELAYQTCETITKIGSMMKDLHIKLLIGGTSIQDDIDTFRNNPPQVIVGTPGRVYDMMKRKYLNTKHMRLFVMDEADDMLSTGFKEQIYNIFQFFPSSVQVALFSATIPTDVMDLTKRFLIDPIKITMRNEQLNLDCIQQYYIALQNDQDKYATLKILYENLNVAQSIIYVNSVKRVVELYDALLSDGFSVSCIHSSMTKKERETAFQNFKNGTSRVLVSSDITARGIDIQQVSIVINFDITKCVHTYLHRIGRSGRWGRKGMAINFVTRQDIEYMKNIETHYKSVIKELPIDCNIQSIVSR
jgi:translation initiation factor 4A